MEKKKPDSKETVIGTVVGLGVAKGAKFWQVLKALKAWKLIKTFGTMLISVFAYSFGMGWKFAAGFVLLLFIHEMGHVIANKKLGIESSWPMFIPFLGALIFVPGFKSRREEAISGYGGPLLGAIASFAVYGVWMALPSHPPLLLALSYTSAFLNLFNLIPIRPLDGGRITQIVGGWIAYAGLFGLIAYMLYERSADFIFILILILLNSSMFPILGFVIGMVGSSFFVANIFLDPKTGPIAFAVELVFITLFNGFLYSKMQTYLRGERPEEDAFPPEPMPVRIRWSFLYVGLAAALGWLMFIQRASLPIPHA